MVEFSKRFDLSKFDAFVPIGVFLLHLFDGDDFARFDVRGLVNCPESSIAQSFYRFIFLHLISNYKYNKMF